MLQETFRVVRAERESFGGLGALQQAHERGSVLRGLLQDADAVRTDQLSSTHAGTEKCSFIFFLLFMLL